MFRSIEYSIGLRYIRSKKRNRFISFITLISIFCIIIGIAVIITVLSVMNGFKEEIQTKLLDFTAHGSISTFDNNLKNWENLLHLVAENEEIVAIAPYVETQAMLTQDKYVSGVYLRGISPQHEKSVSALNKHMVSGSLDNLKANEWNIILGNTLARRLSVAPGDKVTLFTSRISMTPAGMMPRVRRFTVAGIFKIGMSQFDRQAALIHIQDAQKITQLDNSVSGVNLRYQDPYQAPQISQRLFNKLNVDYWVSDWTKRHSNFFRALEMEKLILLIIMTLIIAITSFNIVSALIMVVTEKHGDIAILKTMGMTPVRILKIFITQGCIIGLIGVILGVLAGVLLASQLEDIILVIEKLTDYKFLSPDVYPITTVPSHILLSDIVITSIITFVFTMLATLYPAWRATQVQPSEALRYE